MAVRPFELEAAGGRRLEGFVAGAEKGPVVLMHHGTPGSGTRIWPPHEQLARERGLRVVEYSRPGAGASDRLEGRGVGQCAEDAAAIADSIGADAFYTVGGSGGGPHALACAALLPDRVIAAATVAGVAPYDAEGLDWLDGMGRENIEEFAAAEESPEALERFISRWAEKERDITGDQILAALGDLVSGPDAEVLTGAYADHAAAGTRDALAHGYWGWFDDDLAFVRDWGFDLSSIEVPVTIWQGREDRFVPLAHGEWLAANVPGAKSNLLPGHGHLSLAVAHFDLILDDLTAAR
jgi:pimeloyl-ACP methyl ester carboxylesterase